MAAGTKFKLFFKLATIVIIVIITVPYLLCLNSDHCSGRGQKVIMVLE